MIRSIQIRTMMSFIAENIRRRPLLLPAVIMAVFMNVYFLVFTEEGVASYISGKATVRHIDYRSDGSSEIILVTQDGKRLLYKVDELTEYDIGDSVFVEGTVKIPDKPTNPGEFDYSEYLRRKGIYGLLYPDEVLLTGKGPGIIRIASYIGRFFYQVRMRTLAMFDDPDRAYASALYMGDTSLLDDDMRRAFRISDCSHLLAVSGTHFAGFLLIVSEILKKPGVKRKVAVPVFVLFCLMTGSFTGWSESVTRAFVISVMSFMSRDYISAMSLASIMLFVKDPYCVLSPGFQMSFAVSLSIRLLGGRIKTLLLRIRLPATLSDILTPVFASMVGMMPFWSRTSYYLSFVHIFTQIIASFIVTLSCIFFIPSVITGLPFVCSFLFKILDRIIALCSSVALSCWSSEGLSPYFVYSLMAFTVVCLMPYSVIRKVLLIPSVTAVMIFGGFTAASYITAPEVRIVFIDVGQGDSCLIMSRGRSILIDGGVEDEGRYSVAPVLDYYGIDKVDFAIASHMDEDHIGGLDYLESQGRIGTFLTCFDLHKGDVIYMTDDIRLDCLWPCTVTDGGNEDSVVLRFEYEEVSVLFTGDIGFESEEQLINEGAILDSDILKVGHHGSSYSTCSEFIECVSPQTAVISVARNSPYGHPAPSTVQRLEDYGCEIRMTALEGAIIYEFS